LSVFLNSEETTNIREKVEMSVLSDIEATAKQPAFIGLNPRALRIWFHNYRHPQITNQRELRAEIGKNCRDGDCCGHCTVCDKRFEDVNIFAS
jgi:hypothetical protein